MMFCWGGGGLSIFITVFGRTVNCYNVTFSIKAKRGSIPLEGVMKNVTQDWLLVFSEKKQNTQEV